MSGISYLCVKSRQCAVVGTLPDGHVKTYFKICARTRRLCVVRLG